MSWLRRPRLGIFGRTYGLMLASVLGAEALIFSAMLFTAPSLPPIVEFPRLLELLEGDTAAAADLRIDITIESKAPPGGEDAASQALASAIRREEGLARDSVRVDISGIGPPTPFGPQPVDSVARGARPLVLVGEFTVARRLADGRWRVLRSDPSFVWEATIRLGLLLLGTLALVVPAAYLLARHSTRPIRRFAEAAERLGRDPHAPPLVEQGPQEIRVAAEAFNQMQQQLASYIEERTTMVAAVAHDLRTPLMRMAFEIEEAPQPLQQALTAQIREMREMVDAIMRFLRAEHSRHHREPLDLDVLVREIVESFARDGAAARIAGHQGALSVVGDPAGLKSVMRNIIGNAITYGQEAEVEMTEREGRAVVSVRDRGPGLAELDLKRVFQPFYRVEKSRNRATGGIGLGLTIARSIVAAHGGGIVFANRPEGGLETIVHLPLWRSGRN
ncbi:sensor histidine kinase [Erythrobacter sp. NE805]|uniref:sensor histidine kinase n=1 Tax=Erythrobacter sp. NE805 TaxID=3389875 RepID=UPI00396B025C